MTWPSSQGWVYVKQALLTTKPRLCVQETVDLSTTEKLKTFLCKLVAATLGNIPQTQNHSVSETGSKRGGGDAPVRPEIKLENVSHGKTARRNSFFCLCLFNFSFCRE